MVLQSTVLSDRRKIIEPASSAGGRGSSGINLVFLHGITITRPDWMPEHESVDVNVQRDRLSGLAERERAYANGVAQVSRPAAVRREIYNKYGEKFSDNGRLIDVGKSCPVWARKIGWLEVSREAFVEGWQKGRHRLFDAAAHALMRREFTGKIQCR